MFRQLKDLFVPHHGNSYRPNFLERVSVGVMLVLILLSFAIANLQALLWVGSDWLVSTILPAVIVELTNEERSVEDLVTLDRDPLLDAAAQMKAEDMVKNGYFAHYSPTGVSPWYWFDQVSYDFVHAGENLAVHFTDSSDVVEAWMDSPSHRANILNGEYREIGIGTAKGEYKGHSTVFVVQLFGTKKAEAEEVAGASTEALTQVPAGEVVVEKVVETDAPTTDPSVAPATIETAGGAEEAAAIQDPLHQLALAEEPTTVSEVPVQATEEVESQPEESIVLYSDLATTTRPGVPAIIDDINPPESRGGAADHHAIHSATEPALWLQTVYAVLAGVVIIALMLSMFIEWRQQHPVQIVYAGGLLAIMAVLLHVHTVLTGGVTIV